MKRRYHMEGTFGVFIEAEFTPEGLSYLKSIRKLMNETFKRKRIKEVIQAYPSKVPTRVVLDHK